MYFSTKRTIIIEEKTTVQYGIADATKEFCYFTENKEDAENLALLLNENKVEAAHVLDIIEDMFYT